MKPTLEMISGIECLSVKSDNAKNVVIIFHGYGANMHDLFPLIEMWHKPDTDFYFPNGILPLEMGAYGGRAWFPIDMNKLQLAMMRGEHRNMDDDKPEGADQVLEKLETFVKEVSNHYEKVILGGFSQGAMCTSHLLMRLEKISGVILLSGNLVYQEGLTKKGDIPFYQSHGLQDPVLGYPGAQRLTQRLNELGYKGSLDTFEGGHEIPMKVVNNVSKFLDSLIMPK